MKLHSLLSTTALMIVLASPALAQVVYTPAGTNSETGNGNSINIDQVNTAPSNLNQEAVILVGNNNSTTVSQNGSGNAASVNANLQLQYSSGQTSPLSSETSEILSITQTGQNNIGEIFNAGNTAPVGNASQLVSANNTVSITETGNQNFVSSAYAGASNSIITSIAGNNNDVTTTTYGNNNIDTVNITGNNIQGEVGAYNASGNNNTANLQLQGAVINYYVSQNNVGNTASINASGVNTPGYSVDGVTIIQNGGSNASVLLSGMDSFSSIEQNGYSDTANTTQTGNSDSASITQNANGSLATITQSGGNGNSATILQEGAATNLVASIAQTGSNNTFSMHQH